jgi:RimJ/RimL family protein N-acetyltransferase
MLHFETVTLKNAHKLRKYYADCDYRLCEYSLGVQLMWREWLHPSFAEAAGCLILHNCVDGKVNFDFPVPGPDGDVEGALRAMEDYCTQIGQRLVISVVPEEFLPMLLARYPYLRIANERAWKDYLYRAEDLQKFPGRKYAGRRNHVHQFHKAYPNAHFVPLTAADGEKIEAFWAEFEPNFDKTSLIARRELAYAKKMLRQLKRKWFVAGGIELDGRLIALSMGEKCGDTLIVHIEKALRAYEGVYPTIVQEFATYYSEGITCINREDDACDAGLRRSKMQYRPAGLGSKYRLEVGNELDNIKQVPTVKTARLTLTALDEADRDAYNTLCLDEERNRWWGYDYHTDLKGEWTEDYFLQVARQDFAAHNAVNFAVRLDGQLIGEAVLYNFDWRGGAELGCRILPAFAHHGYGTEAFASAAEWALYELHVERVVAKCFRENEASYQMLSACMRETAPDETYFHFEKTV